MPILRSNGGFYVPTYGYPGLPTSPDAVGGDDGRGTAYEHPGAGFPWLGGQATRQDGDVAQGGSGTPLPPPPLPPVPQTYPINDSPTEEEQPVSSILGDIARSAVSIYAQNSGFLEPNWWPWATTPTPPPQLLGTVPTAPVQGPLQNPNPVGMPNSCPPGYYFDPAANCGAGKWKKKRRRRRKPLMTQSDLGQLAQVISLAGKDSQLTKTIVAGWRR